MRICFALFVCSLLPGADFSARWEEIRKTAAPAELYRILWDLPKGGDLHNHLTLSIRPETFFRLATRPNSTQYFTRMKFSGCPDSVRPFLEWQTVPEWRIRNLSECARAEYMPLPSLSDKQKAEWLSAMILDKPNEGRDEFFEAIAIRRQPMAMQLDLLYEAVAEHLKDRAAENLLYLETQFVPLTGFDPSGKAIPPEEGVRLLRERLSKPDLASLPLTTRFLFILVRFQPAAERNLEYGYNFVSANHDLWVGLNMAGREDNDNGQIGRFTTLFRKMRRTHPGVPLSLHAGETTAPGTQIRDTMVAGAERIGHGLNLLSDPSMYLMMREGKTLIEINLISNRLLGYVPDLDLHPFPEYLRTGVPVCLNTDDPGVWDSNFTDEYFEAVKRFNLSWDEIVRIGRDSLIYSFASPQLKTQLLQRYDDAVHKFEQKYAYPDWRAPLDSVKVQPSGYAIRQFGIPAGS